MQRIRTLVDKSAGRTVVVALDGRSGAGKSTLAAEVGRRLGALVVDGDDFYTGGPDDAWAAMVAAEKVDRVIDWRRQRDLLARLGRGEAVTWHPYDWQADDGRMADVAHAGGPASVVILDGAYSARAELSGVVTLRVLLEVSLDLRRERLAGRDGVPYRDAWEACWMDAEDLYFGTLMPPRAFDLVLDGS